MRIPQKESILFWLFFLSLIIYSCSANNQTTANAALSASDIDSIYSHFSSNKDSAEVIDFTSKFDPLKLQQEIKLLKLILEEAQTGLYRYSSKEEVDNIFEEALASSKDSINYFRFIQLVSRIQNTIACGHSGWSHPESFRKFRAKNLRLFPFDIVILQNRFYVKHNNSLNAEVPVFAEITHVNGKTVAEIITELKKHMNRDGNSNPSGTKEIELYFPIAYSNFIDNPDIFTIRLIKEETSSPEQVEIRPLLLSVIDSIRNSRYGPGQVRDLPLRYKTIDSLSTAVYTIEWFRNEYISSKGQEFISFTDSVFKDIEQKKLTNLIIDLRDNVGGWTANGAHLFSYFVDEPTGYVKRVKVKKFTNYSFKPLIQNEAGYLDTFDLQLTPEHVFEWKNHPLLKVKPSEQNRFRGNCYVLINDYTRSASSIFCSLMKEHSGVVFIGEETGAAQCGPNGMVMSVQLPYTGLYVYFSTAMYELEISDPTNFRGIVPDVAVYPSSKSLKKQVDVELDTALKLIQAQFR